MLLNFVKLGGWQLPGVEISWVAIFGVEIVLGRNCPGGSHPEWQFSGWDLSLVGIYRMGVIMGGNFLWWGFSWWELSCRNHPCESFHVSFKHEYSITFRIKIHILFILMFDFFIRGFEIRIY